MNESEFRRRVELRSLDTTCPSCARLRAEVERLRNRLQIRIDTVEGIPTGMGEDEIDRLYQRIRELEGAVDNLPFWIAIIKAERMRQDQKWGEQDHDDLYWLGILVEEVGELAKEIISDGKNGAKELSECAAVCVAWMEAVRRRARGGG